VQAVVVQRYGGPEVLELLDWPEPEVGPGDVLIPVYAVTVGRTLDVEVAVANEAAGGRDRFGREEGARA
jgi:NADPH:quinone reductase-like Zn-dependent oxidoreductase